MKRICAVFLSAVLFLPLALFSSCASPRQFQKTDLTLFDTQTVIIGCEADSETFEKKAGEILEKLEHYHRLYDIYYEYEGVNNLMTVNRAAGEAPVEVDEDIIDLILYSKDMYELTEGKTNIAMGSVLSVWHKYRNAGLEDPENAVLPPMEELQEAALHTDINKVIVDEERRTVFLEDGEMSLDVGAIAKGYAVEMTALFCEEMGYTGYALSVGGNVRCIGEKTGGEKWEIGIQNPDLTSDKAFYATAYLATEALVTSGDYQRFYTVAEKKYHHIIDPDTLMPQNTYAAVSVIADHSGLADALSTALFNLSEEEGLAIAEKAGANVAWVYHSGAVEMTDGFKELTE